jgi:hypothetical protein
VKEDDRPTEVQGKVYAVQLCDGPLDGMTVAWHEDACESGFAHPKDEAKKEFLCSTYRIVTPTRARYIETTPIPDPPAHWNTGEGIPDDEEEIGEEGLSDDE